MIQKLQTGQAVRLDYSCLQKSKNDPVYTLDNFKKIATVFMCGFPVAAAINSQSHSLQMALLMKTSRKPSKFIVLTWTILQVPYNFFTTTHASAMLNILCHDALAQTWKMASSVSCTAHYGWFWKKILHKINNFEICLWL